MSSINNEKWNHWQLVGLDHCTPEQLVDEDRLAAECDVTPWELAIFDSIWYGQGQCDTRKESADRAFGGFRSKDPAKAEAAIERCFREGWIQHLTPEFLRDMRAELESGGYIMANGLIGSDPFGTPGLISFTQSGVALFKKWLRFDPQVSRYANGHDTDGTPAVFGTSIEMCEYCMEILNGLNSMKLTTEVVGGGAEPIGRWCDRWWNRFETGYRIRYVIKDNCDQGEI